MSGLELAGLVLGILGPLEQSITLFNLIRNHLKSNKTIKNIISQLISSLAHLQYDLQQLENQLQQDQKSIPQNNYITFKTHLTQLKQLLSTVHYSLIDIEQSAKNKLSRFRKATKWAEECQSIQLQINDAQHKVLQISSFLGQNATIRSVVTETTKGTEQKIRQSENKLVHAIESSEASSSTERPQDKFKPYFRKLPVSIVAKSCFDAVDSLGNPLTTEGKLKKKLLGNFEMHHTKVFAIQGPAGVGKTTCMHMLSHDQQIRHNFTDGIYYIKLGADAKEETAISEISSVVRKSGGSSKARDIENAKGIDNAMKVASEWLRDKKFLLLVDDIWQRKEVECHLLSLFKYMLSESNEGGMVFTTRDPSIATEAAEALQLNCRDPQGPESRGILFRHAKQNCLERYEEETEECITLLLRTCGGLPVAHSVVGKGVLRYSMKRNVRPQDAWRLYARRQQNILQGRADGYECLYTVSKAAIRFLEEEDDEYTEANERRKRYCYGEMHRSLSVLERQQCATVEMLGCMWNLENEEDVREICENLVRAGLAEWHIEDVPLSHPTMSGVEGIYIHDLLHSFALEEAKRKNEIETWHRRVVDGYADRLQLVKINGDDCREWWRSRIGGDKEDGGYLMRNICRHLRHLLFEKNELATLITRPEWIEAQLSTNGLVQYERDVHYSFEWMEKCGKGTEDGVIGMQEIEMIHDAVRLSASYVYKNSSEVWFQLYGRLVRMEHASEEVKKYLKYVERYAPRPWLRPVDGLLTSVGIR